jgi:hypothetical protein
MNIIETAKAILHGDEDIDPMEVVRAVARLEPVSGQYKSGDSWHNYVNAEHQYNTELSNDWETRKLYTLEADK